VVTVNNKADFDVTIIIVNWNTVDMLCECLDSVLAGLVGIKAEILVVDNASQDGSQLRVRDDYKQVILIANSKNVGFAAANNQAMKIANGRYILLLNSDTVVLGDVIPRSVNYLESRVKVGAMGCHVLNTDGTVQPTCANYPTVINLILLTSGLWKLPWPNFFDRYQMRRWDRKNEKEVEVVSGCYLMVRAEVIKEVGLLDEDFFFFGEETDWCYRMRAAGWQLWLAPVGKIIHHAGGSARRLNYQRDLMLSSAMVKLHLKHSGKLSALIVLAVVSSFNASRAIFWILASLVYRNKLSRDRRDHFVALSRNWLRIWPKKKTWQFESD
jgi:GT2 family glycosyltransferase